MTIPKRLEELLEEQENIKRAGTAQDIAAGLGAASLAQGGLDPVTDVGALGAEAVAEAPAIAEGIGSAADAVGSVAEDAGSWAGNAVKGVGSWVKGLFGGGSTAADSAASTDAAASTAGSTAADTAAAVKGGIAGGIASQAGNAAKSGVGTIVHDITGGGGSSSNNAPLGAYGGDAGGGGPIQIGRQLASKQAATDVEMQILDTVKDIPRLLEMILENVCGCGQPTAGKYNGMPHCIPGSGCSTNVSLSATNPTGDNCCSCGNPNCAGTFHGQPVCAPGQGCNDHWDAEKGSRKWNPAVESPAEKIADHDNWAAETNHGEFEMPEDGERATTWE